MARGVFISTEKNRGYHHLIKKDEEISSRYNIIILN